MTGTSGLTVATYNLYLGADLSLLFGVGSVEELGAAVAEVRGQLERTSFAERAGAVARILVREAVDVVGLQEVSRWAAAPLGPDGGLGAEEVLVDFLPTLLAELAAARKSYDVHAAHPSFAGGLPVAGSWMSVQSAGVVLVRRDGPLQVTGARTGTYASRADLVTGLDGVSFPIVRGWGWVDGRVDGRPFRFVNTHTEAWDPVTRDAQRDELVRLLGDAGGPTAVVGDFNASPSEVGLPPAYVDAWTAAGGDPAGGLTCGQDADLANEASTLRKRIDYVFVRDAAVESCRVVGAAPEDRTAGRLWPSDHAGVVARLGF